ncbi:MAG: response regulator transcription factor [Lachnospiraceae bacterium]|nr:response regulator transcription factor [Lachnospiraceae bacterium]
MRILIAEDEISTAKALKVLLEKSGYAVDIVHNGNEAWDYISSGAYDGIILDIMMPGMSGMDVLVKIRKQKMNTPVLMLTAKAELEDRIEGLESGADDYLPKPFATRELVARLKALLRRGDRYMDTVLQIGNLLLDGNRFEMSVHDQNERLTNKEYQLMELFVRHPGMVFSTEHLMETIWGYDSESDIGVVWTHIGFVRKKLRHLKADVEIKTIRGAGYSLEVNRC